MRKVQPSGCVTWQAIVCECVFAVGTIVSLSSAADPMPVDLVASADELELRIRERLSSIDAVYMQRAAIVATGALLQEKLDAVNLRLRDTLNEKKEVTPRLITVNNSIDSLTVRVNQLEAYLANATNRGLGFEEDLFEAKGLLQHATRQQAELAGKLSGINQVGQELEEESHKLDTAMHQHINECKNLKSQWLLVLDPFGKLSRPEHEAAIVRFSEWIGRDFRNASAYLGRGLAYEMCGEMPKALADLHSAVDFDGGVRVLALSCRGRLRHRTGDTTGAEKDFRAALVSDREAYASELESQTQRGVKKQDALAAANAKREPYLYLLQGQTEAIDGNLPQARQKFEAAIELDRDNPDAHRLLALTFLHPSRKLDKVSGSVPLREAQAACKLSGEKDWTCLMALSAAHAVSGDFDRAVRAADRAVLVAQGEHRLFCEGQCRALEGRRMPELPFD